MRDGSPTSIRLAGMCLDIRPSVAFRERAVGDGVVFYLSLLDDEIDDRFERFLASPDAATNTGLAGVERAAQVTELTDAAVFHRRGGKVVVVRGASCTFPLFWSRQPAGVHISTALPLLEGTRFSRAGFAATVSAVCLHGSYEPNASLETPLHGWWRLRRGAITALGKGSGITETPIDFNDEAEANEAEIAEQIRTAFFEYGRSQQRVTRCVLELSGGFDSTLAGAAARTPHNRMLGVSVEFPYYEFRFEAATQRAVAAELDIPRTVFDGTQMFPYAPWEHPPRFDEPSVFVTGIRHAEQVAVFAAAHGATRIYMGHGGDQLFSTDLTAPDTLTREPARPAFTRQGWPAVKRALARIRHPQWRRRTNGCFVYDACQDVWVKETFGASIRTPFTDLAVLRAALMWSRWNASRNVRPDKTILAEALSGLLPDAVIQRKGKVAYDGVWMRAYAAHGEHIARTFERTSAILEQIGISPAWLLRRVRQLANWQPVSDREVLAAYAVSVWLLSWGIERTPEVDWE
jgi:asparagine synthetase B (glutamine-hydrolysing)